MQFNKGKCRVLHPGKNNPSTRNCCRQPAGSSSAGKELGVLVGTKLGTSEQCALSAKRAHSNLGCSGQSLSSKPGEVILSLYSTLKSPAQGLQGAAGPGAAVLGKEAVRAGAAQFRAGAAQGVHHDHISLRELPWDGAELYGARSSPGPQDTAWSPGAAISSTAVLAEREPWHREQRAVGVLATLIRGEELERMENVHPLLLTCSVNSFFFSTVQVSPTFLALFKLVHFEGESAFLGHVGGHITGLDHVVL